MDLRSGHPFWLLKNGLLADYPSLKHNESCEVAVIGGGITGAPAAYHLVQERGETGAGITGALAAYYLVQEGVETVLVDKRDIGGGITAASTALLQYEIDTELHHLIVSWGGATAART